MKPHGSQSGNGAVKISGDPGSQQHEHSPSQTEYKHQAEPGQRPSHLLIGADDRQVTEVDPVEVPASRHEQELGPALA